MVIEWRVSIGIFHNFWARAQHFWLRKRFDWFTDQLRVFYLPHFHKYTKTKWGQSSLASTDPYSLRFER